MFDSSGAVGVACAFDEPNPRINDAADSVVFASSVPSSTRSDLEKHIDAGYGAAFRCHVPKHYPNLVGIRAPGGAIRAASGFRLAGEDTLFLESYLERPIEAEITSCAAAPVDRKAIAEIGNLAACDRASAILLFRALATLLSQLGCSYAAATATAPLRRIFRVIGFRTVELAGAEPTRLPDGGAAWGRYYDLRPKVICGPIDECLQSLRARA